MEKADRLAKPFSGIQAEVLVAILISVLLSLSIVIASELKFSFKAALLAGSAGAACITLMPNRRIALVIAWILVHPLSLEKVVQFGSPIYPGFIPPQMVISASDIVLVGLGTYLLLEGLIKRQYVWEFSSPMIPLAAFIFWSIFVFVLTGPTVNSSLGIVHNLKMFAFVLIMSSSVRTRDEFKWVLMAIAIAVGIQAVLVGITSVTAQEIRFSSKISNELMAFSGAGGQGHVRATGTVGHVNQEASFLTFFGLPLLGLMVAQGFSRRAFAWIAFSGTMIAIILTFSRSAWVSLLFAGICLFILLVKKEKIVFNHWIYGPPILIVLFAVVLTFGKPVLDRTFHGDEGATSSRMRAIRLSLDLIRKHPIMGVGHWNFAKATLDEYPPTKMSQMPEDAAPHYGRLEITQVRLGQKIITIPLPVHNKYLLIFSELGIIGLLIYIGFQIAVFKLLRKSLRTRDKMLEWSAIGIMTAFWATQPYMNLDLFSDDKTMQILLFVPVLGMIVHKLTAQQRRNQIA